MPGRYDKCRFVKTFDTSIAILNLSDKWEADKRSEEVSSLTQQCTLIFHPSICTDTLGKMGGAMG